MTTKQNRRIKAVLFDLDDTLIDWSQPAHDWISFTRPMSNNVHTFLTAAGYTLPKPTEFEACLNQEIQAEWNRAKQDWSGPEFGAALHRALVACELPAGEIDLDEVLRAYNWQPMPGVELFSDTIEVLETLKDRGYLLGLITNSFFPMWMRDVELETYGLLHYFDARLTSSDAGYMKPHPQIYLKMLETMGVEPAEAVFVGDRPENDIAGANEAGLVSVLMDPPHLERDRKGIEPDF